MASGNAASQSADNTQAASQAGAAGAGHWPELIFADGQGLPAGQGTPARGKALYAEHCASCHGPQGEGGRAIELVGDRSLLATQYPDRGIAVFWPYAPPLFDYIRRAMPPDAPWSLSAQETYSVTAWLLVLNGLIDEHQMVDAALLSELEMPNREGFDDAMEMPSR